MDTTRIRTRRLGRDGPEVGVIGLGCMGMTWAYGPDDGAETPADVITRGLELGVDHLDTADAYGPDNETTVGRALRGRRDRVVLATKGGNVARTDADGNPMLPHPDGRPEHLRAAIDASLRRLGTDRIDVYHLHRPDPAVPVEDSVGAIAEAVTAGKVRAVGVSELSVEQLDRAHAVHPIAAVQSELSLWSREHLRTSVPWCARNGAAFVAYSPLGRGFLTGGFRDAEPQAGDIRASMPRFRPENRDANAAIVDAVAAVAERHGASTGQVALAWVLAQGRHVLAIPGTRRRSRLEENAAAAALRLDERDLAELDALPEPAGARY